MAINFISTFSSNKKIYNYIEEIYRGKALFLFEHGLGDLMLFMPLFRELRHRFPRWRFQIGANVNRGFNFLGEDYYPIKVGTDVRNLLQLFTFIFQVRYPEPPHINEGYTVKPYLCNVEEMGIPEFEWKPYTLPVTLKNKDSNIIGVHFFGNTNSHRKCPTENCVKKMCNEMKLLGFTPYEIHMLHPYTFDQNRDLGKAIFNSSNSLRYEKPDIQKMVDKIVECKYFIGVDSGPLYLAGSILGFDKVIGIQKDLKIKRYLPIKIPIVSVDHYLSMTLHDALKMLIEKDNGR